MPAKQGNSRNRIKRLCVLGILTAVCLIFGFIESLIPTSAIAPGIKLGLSNAVALMLITGEDFKGAFAVNIVRIFLSALLFGSLFSLVFSLTAGVISLLLSITLVKTRKFSPVGVGIFGGVIHNAVQLTVAVFICGKGVLWYLPLLLLGGMLSGAFVGALTLVVLKKVRINGTF